MLEKEINTAGTDTIVGAMTLSECHGRQQRGAFSSRTIEVRRVGSAGLETWVQIPPLPLKIIGLQVSGKWVIAAPTS